MKNTVRKKSIIIFILLLIVIQFFRPVKNTGTSDSGNSIMTKYSVPPDIQQLLKTSCYDCHSNNTVYPWYSNVQPVSWWLESHINDGKRRLNFDEFAMYDAFRQQEKLKEIASTINKDEMPLGSYTLIHKNAILTKGQKKALTDWVNKNTGAQ